MKRAFISGASSGLGNYICELLSSRGWQVYAGYRQEKDKEELDRLGATPLRLDVADERSVKEAIKEIERTGGLDLLVNNAGIGLGGPLELLPTEGVKEVFGVNVFGLIGLSKAAIPLLRLSKGRIVNMGSISGLYTAPYTIPYSASKFAVEAISDGLRRELEPQGVKVVLIEPGTIRTPLWEKARQLSSSLAQGPASDLYADKIAKLQRVLDRRLKKAPEPKVLRRAIISACEDINPKRRYLGWRSNWLTAKLIRLLPDAALDKIIYRMMK